MNRPRRVLVAMASYKGTMAAGRACRVTAEAISSTWPQTAIELLPLADGGGGTVDAVLSVLAGESVRERVTGPLGEPVEAAWGRLHDGATAVIEMAAASGLALVPPQRRDPMHTTTRGTGELIAAALARGCRKILLGIGDSATVEGGLGAAQALGAIFRDQSGRPIDEPIAGRHLRTIASLRLEAMADALRGADIEVLCDVNNPLLGPNGAAAIFGPQKGATAETIPLLEEGLAHVYRLIEQATGRRVVEAPGAGAAGGLGAGAMAMMNARLVPGTERLLALQGFREKLARGDLVVTGEGRFDTQSLRGKATGRVIAEATARGVPVVLFSGRAPDERDLAQRAGIERLIVLREPDAADPDASDAEKELARAVSGYCENRDGEEEGGRKKAEG